jgi:hypothetical protein
MALPAASLTLASTVTLYHVSDLRLDAGFTSAVLPEYVTSTATSLLFSESLIVCLLMDDASIASLNVIKIVVLTGTFSTPWSGVTEITLGAVVSEGGNAPVPPHPAGAKTVTAIASIRIEQLTPALARTLFLRPALK